MSRGRFGGIGEHTFLGFVGVAFEAGGTKGEIGVPDSLVSEEGRRGGDGLVLLLSIELPLCEGRLLRTEYGLPEYEMPEEVGLLDFELVGESFNRLGSILHAGSRMGGSSTAELFLADWRFRSILR